MVAQCDPSVGSEADTAPPGALMVGSPVLLKGLVAKPEWNGRKAKIVSFLHDAGKYEIKLDDVDVVVKVKPENVELALKQLKKKIKRRGSDVDSPWGERRQLVLEAVRRYIAANESSWTKSLMKEELAEELGLPNDQQMAAFVTMALKELDVRASRGLNLSSPTLTPDRKRARATPPSWMASSPASPDVHLVLPASTAMKSPEPAAEVVASKPLKAI